MTVADLSPDALARLEAKLVADLDMVRKVRALLEDHQTTLGTLTAALPPVEATPAPVLQPAKATISVKSQKDYDDILMDCLIATAGQPFAPQDFKQAVYQVLRNYPNDNSVKIFFNQMIRQGKLVVHQFRKGRPGSLYRSLIPPPAAPENPPDLPAESAEVPETVSLPSPQP
jgi:hypothetical protein